MSFRQDLSTFANLSRENKRSSKYLLASRWAPGGLEDKVESNDGSAFGGKALAKFRSATEPIEYMQPPQDSHTDNTPATTNTKPTPGQTIDPRTGEENRVKIENPFVDLNKHKGLGSSRWAKE